MDEALLVERCAAGDDVAWEALVRRHEGRIYAVALHYLRDEEEARDVAQEIFIRIYRGMASFRGDRFEAWMMRLARNACIDRIRRIKVRPPASDLAVEEGADPPDRGAGPEEAAIDQGRKRLLRRAMDQMSEINREILLLKEIQGLKMEEIADLLQLPLGTVKSRSSRARVELATRVRTLDPSYGA